VKKVKTNTMKNISRLIKGAGFLFLMMSGVNNLQAQTTVNIDYGYDSTWYGYCQVPIQIMYGGGGTTTGYNYLTDDMDIHIFWGDGSDTIFSTPLYNNMLNDYFYFNASHNYMSPGAFTITIVATGVDGNDDTLTYGPLFFSATCNIIDGYLYLDNNSNCTYDAGDDPISYFPVAAVDPGTGNFLGYGYSDVNGYYSFSVPSGFPVNLVTSPYYPSPAGYTTTCPASGMYSFTTTAGTSSYNFGVECSNAGFDLEVYGSGWGFVPGLNGVAYGGVWNWGCMPVSGSVTITSGNPLVTFTGGSYNGNPAPNSFTSSSATYNFTNLFGNSPYWWNNYIFYPEVYTDTTAMIGDSVCFTYTVTPTAGDVNVANNTFTVCLPILASWDPNMKEVYPAGEGATGNIAPNTTLTYTVYFQNTGLYPAADIYILDTIDTDLDMSTLEILGSSHTMNPIIFGGNKIKFDFPNINLIDSTTNEPLSHGYVIYRIKTKTGLANGTQIHNTAHIFFDYNPAVVTNTTLNTIDILLGLEEQVAVVENSIYPNPVSDMVNVSFSQPVSGMLQVRDITGRIVYSNQIKNSSLVSLNVSNWNTGMYEVVVSGSELSSKRFIVAR
jgi:uncharacterized repeat protein (TIGR01451 family)